MFSLKPGELKLNVLSGLTVSLALVPEAIAFALVAQAEKHGRSERS
jgi:SulP family sulfate permease